MSFLKNFTLMRLRRSLTESIGSYIFSLSPYKGFNNSDRSGSINEEGDTYFVKRKSERTNLINCLSRYFIKRKKISFCSVGTGFGGEESILANGINDLFLIEPNETSYNFLKNKFKHKNTKCIKNFYQNVFLRKKVDVVYASSLGNWMNEDPMKGCPDDFMEFLKNNLESSGIGIFLIYGGLHKELVIKSRAYISKLKGSFNSYGFMINRYSLLSNKSALLIISNGKKKLDGFERLNTIPIIKDDNFLNHRNIQNKNKFIVILMTLLFALINMFKSFKGIIYDFFFVFKVINKLFSKD